MPSSTTKLSPRAWTFEEQEALRALQGRPIPGSDHEPSYPAAADLMTRSEGGAAGKRLADGISFDATEAIDPAVAEVTTASTTERYQCGDWTRLQACADDHAEETLVTL